MKNTKQMKAKNFVLLMGIAFLAALALLAGSVFFAQKMWGIKSNLKTGEIDITSHFTTRFYKAEYIAQKPDAYTAFIIGGSKASALRPEVFEKFSDNHFYNYFIHAGNFRDYEINIDFLLKNYDAKEIILHLSSHESESYSYYDFVAPAICGSAFAKILNYGRFIKLYSLNPQTFIDSVKNRKKNKGLGISAPTGERTLADDAFVLSSYEQDAEKFHKDVFCYWNDYDSALRNLFHSTPFLPACDKNIQALKRIKALCEEKGVTLTVVIGPTFIAECYKYATPQYIQYVKDIVSVCGKVWNFSGINDENLNPYNFYNGGHCWTFAGDRMIETMFSPEPNETDLDAFGILLSAENADAFISRQKEKHRALKEEYERTGKITLQSKDDESYLGARSN